MYIKFVKNVKINKLLPGSEHATHCAHGWDHLFKPVKESNSKAHNSAFVFSPRVTFSLLVQILTGVPTPKFPVRPV